MRLANVKCGVYCIYNIVNGKVYVGRSIDIESRWGQHRSELNSGEHHNPHLQSAWLKYGAEAFSFFILAECSERVIPFVEHYFIKSYVTYGHDYNIDLCYNGKKRSKVYTDRIRDRQYYKKVNWKPKGLKNDVVRIIKGRPTRIHVICAYCSTVFVTTLSGYNKNREEHFCTRSHSVRWSKGIK